MEYMARLGQIVRDERCVYRVGTLEDNVYSRRGRIGWEKRREKSGKSCGAAGFGQGIVCAFDERIERLGAVYCDIRLRPAVL